MSQFPPPAEQPLPPGPPLTLDYATPTEPRVDLRGIALRQRASITCILAYIIAAAGALTLPVNVRSIWAAEVFLALLLLPVISVFAFTLSVSVYNNPVAGTIGGILTLVPVLGLFILVVINADAIKILRRHGVRVGLLGARLRDVPPRGDGAHAVR